MGTTAASPLLLLRTRKKVLTYDDYIRLTPSDSGNYELHNGQIVYIPSPTPAHQRITGYFFRKMADFAESNQLGEVFIAPLDTKFDTINTLQPDVMFISAGRTGMVTDKKIDGAPDLVVEVLSEGNSPKDMSFKKYIYESFGVREYWLVNLKKNTLTQYLNRDGEFVPKKVHQKADLLCAEVLPGFELPLDKVL